MVDEEALIILVKQVILVNKQSLSGTVVNPFITLAADSFVFVLSVSILKVIIFSTFTKPDTIYYI